MPYKGCVSRDFVVGVTANRGQPRGEKPRLYRNPPTSVGRLFSKSRKRGIRTTIAPLRHGRNCLHGFDLPHEGNSPENVSFRGCPLGENLYTSSLDAGRPAGSNASQPQKFICRPDSEGVRSFFSHGSSPSCLKLLVHLGSPWNAALTFKKKYRSSRKP